MPSGWNKVMINVSGQSGEKMDLALDQQANRMGLATSQNYLRPKNLNAIIGKKETLENLRRTFYSNSSKTNKFGVPETKIEITKPKKVI
jgi:hypothetical protein